MLENRTRYPDRVYDAPVDVLKSGMDQRKIGPVVTKGRWKGFRIFTLTLEERATCPPTCAQLASCYGNNMQWSSRYRHGDELQARLFLQLVRLQDRFPRGFVVRLHILGDFYSVTYVDFWALALDEFPALHVFGYTAHPANGMIGAKIAALRDKHWDRFAVRTSGAKEGPRTNVYASQARIPRGTIYCPVQRMKSRNCGTCALCWATDKPIAFLQH